MSRSLLRDLAARNAAVDRAIADQRARNARLRASPPMSDDADAGAIGRPRGSAARACKKCGEPDARICECTLVRLGGDE